ncbi:hypothetical protein D3C71_819830 [compost metagenome]
MVAYSQRKLPTFEGNHDATVKAALKGLLGKGWGTDAQCVWIMGRVVDELHCSVSKSVWDNRGIRTQPRRGLTENHGHDHDHVLTVAMLRAGAFMAFAIKHSLTL